MSTINDVARLADVSTMTVSRVVNNSDYVSAATRARVERAISELGYVPNALARQFRSKRTKTIALVMADITNPFFTTVARGVEDVAGKRGFGVLFCNTDESETREVDYVSMLVQRQVDGVLLVPATSSSRSLALLGAHRVPVVIVDRRVRSDRVDVVRGDSVAGARTLAQHLIQLGHRRIAILAGRKIVSTSVDRVTGFTRALSAAGIVQEPRLVRYGGYHQSEGYAMALEVLEERPGPTAIFAANNFIAVGAMRAIREAGLHAPDDLSIVGFDDLPPDWSMDPFLTVVAQPAYTFGQRAAELLLERIDGQAPDGARELVLPGELIVRRSSGPPRVTIAA
ncbi:MAG: LacI family DNA-binding transcriptional regulator [Candidatus Limnocylindrales bacterium]